MIYSIIVATYNRLDELKELADSLVAMVETGFPDGVELEWVIVDDGSTDGTKDYLENRSFPFPVRLLSQPNQGPGAARNLGMKHASGDVFIFMDSDCTVPTTYLNAVNEGMHHSANDSLDAFGGPDTYRQDFPPLLKAINYSMTSFLGTGGTRGSTKSANSTANSTTVSTTKSATMSTTKLATKSTKISSNKSTKPTTSGKPLSVTKYYPRSFNMGLSRKVYETIGDMGGLRHGQDMDYSARIYKAGFKVGLIPRAYVYHKRRTSLQKFFKQIFNWGVARINLGTLHPELLKPVHLAPAMLIIMALCVLVGSLFMPVFQTLLKTGLMGLALLLVFVFFQSGLTYRSLIVGILSILTLPLQIVAYGLGSIWGLVQKVSGKDSASGFIKNYYR